MNDIAPRDELLVAHALVSELIRERGQLVAKLKIATDALEAIAATHPSGERYRGACGTAAEDALTQMSVVE